MKLITKIKNVLIVDLLSDVNPGTETKIMQFSDDIFELSGGLYRYEIYRWYDVFQPKLSETKIFQEFDLHTPIQNRTADEIWILGSEKQPVSMMGGARAFWIGENPVPGTFNIYRRFPLMRFGYSDFLGTFARRVENTMYYVYRGYPPAKNMWEKFMKACGTVLRPPNEILEGYSSKQEFFLEADEWIKNYPTLQGNVGKFTNSDEWGGTYNGYLKWWLRHLPRGVHKTDGIHDNWWHCVMNLDLVR